MADVDPADLQLPPPAAVHRQRFYFLRHGQSMNNLYSLQDEADKPLEGIEQEHQRQADEEQQQHRRRRRSPCSQDRCTRQLDPYQSQPELCARNTEQQQYPQKRDAEDTHQEKQQQHLYHGELRGQQLLEGQKGQFPQSEDELRPTGVCPEQQGAGSPRRRTADPSLTEVGRQQAAAAALWVQRHVQETLLRSRAGSKKCGQIAHREGEGLPCPAIKKIVCSPMRRAVETAVELRKVLTVDVYVHPLLFEQGGIFSGPRKVAGSTTPVSDHVAAGVAHDKPRNSNCVGDAWERAGDGSSRSSSKGFELPEVCDSSPVRSRKAVVPTPARRACRYSNSGACEGMTLQEVKALLPGVKIIHCCGRLSCSQHFYARANGNDPAVARLTEGCSNTSVCSSRSVSQSNVEADTVEASGNLDATACKAATESGFVVQQHNKGRAAKEEEVGGHYCEEWTQGGRSWWCGGREKLVDTVLRAAEIVSWMQEECHVAEDTRGSVLMVMHGLMMDLIGKTLMFPFSSVSSATPYLELLGQSLRAHEAASGKPLYNMPQQTAYFISSNCSFCCLELAAAAHQPCSYPSGSSPQSACGFQGTTAPAHRNDFKAARKTLTLMDDRCTAGVERGIVESNLCGRDPQRRSHPQPAQPCGGSVRYFGTENLDVSSRVPKKMCRSPEDVEANDTLVFRDDIDGLAITSLLALRSSQLVTKNGVAVRAGSGRNAADICIQLDSTLRGAVVLGGSGATVAAPSGGTRAPFSSPAPALVSTLIEWNAPIVDPELHSGQTVGS